MIAPLQVLFFFAVALAPAGTHHVTVSGGSEVYGWDKGDALDDANTWVYDRASTDPATVLATNDIIPADFNNAQKKTLKSARQKDASSVLYFDSDHELQKTPLGYVYIVRPGSPNEKFYSFTFK